MPTTMPIPGKVRSNLKPRRSLTHWSLPSISISRFRRSKTSVSRRYFSSHRVGKLTNNELDKAAALALRRHFISHGLFGQPRLVQSGEDDQIGFLEAAAAQRGPPTQAYFFSTGEYLFVYLRYEPGKSIRYQVPSVLAFVFTL